MADSSKSGAGPVHESAAPRKRPAAHRAGTAGSPAGASGATDATAAAVLSAATAGAETQPTAAAAAPAAAAPPSAPSASKLAAAAEAQQQPANKRARMTKRQLREDPTYQKFFKFRTELNRCSAANDCPAAMAVFEQLRADPAVKCNSHMYAMIIALCAKAGDMGGGERVFAHMQTQGVAPDEVVYSSMVKLFSDVDRVAAARAVFDDFHAKAAAAMAAAVEVAKVAAAAAEAAAAAAKQQQQQQRGRQRWDPKKKRKKRFHDAPPAPSVPAGQRVKLRTVVPLFQAYARAHDVEACEGLRALLDDSLDLDPNEPILRALVDAYALTLLHQKKGDGGGGEGPDSAGPTADGRAAGTAMVNATAAMRDPSAIVDAVNKVLADMQDNVLSIGPKTQASLARWFVDACPPREGATPWRVGTCEPDATGWCEESGCRLSRIFIHPQEYGELAGQIEQLVVRGSAKRADQWAAFKKFIAARPGEYDVFIDGANVGFYGQNKGGVCRIHIPQIGVAVEHWVAAGRRPLIVLHRHHRVHNKQHAGLFADWERRGLLFTCEKGNNDDWYWLWAAVQTANPDSLLISNDEMKDHHFNMLRPKHFQRWKVRHQARFHFYWGGAGRRHIDFYPPAVFTRCIQTHHVDDADDGNSAADDGNSAADDGNSAADDGNSAADAAPIAGARALIPTFAPGSVAGPAAAPAAATTASRVDAAGAAADSGSAASAAAAKHDRGPVLAWHFPLRDSDDDDPVVPPAPADADASASEPASSSATAAAAAAASGGGDGGEGGGGSGGASAGVGPRLRLRSGGTPVLEADAGGFVGATRWFFACRLMAGGGGSGGGGGGAAVVGGGGRPGSAE